jgi:hypothetical protein
MFLLKLKMKILFNIFKIYGRSYITFVMYIYVLKNEMQYIVTATNLLYSAPSKQNSWLRHWSYSLLFEKFVPRNVLGVLSN